MPNTEYVYSRDYLEELVNAYDYPDDTYAANARDYADATGDYDLSRFSVGGMRL